MLLLLLVGGVILGLGGYGVLRWLRKSWTFPPFITIADSKNTATNIPVQETKRSKPVYVVTGGTGLIGTRFVKRLLDLWNGDLPDDFIEDHVKAHFLEGTIRMLMRPSTTNQLLLKDFQSKYPRADIQPVWGAGEQEMAIQLLFNGPIDYVFHIAAQGGDWGPVESFYLANEVATRHLVTRALQINEAFPQYQIKRFVHLSSVDIYSKEISPIECVAELSTPLDWQSTFGYTITKARADTLVQEAHNAGLKTTILRPAAVYGTGSYSFGATEAKAIQSGMMVAVNGGNAVSGIVHVDDVVRSMMMCITTPKTDGKIYNISDPSTGTWARFYTYIAQALGKKKAFYSVTYSMALVVSVCYEYVYCLLGWWDGPRPLMTRFVLALVGRDQRWPIESCSSDFGWKPQADFEANMTDMCNFILQKGMHIN